MIETDVVVVGGGVIGAFCAWELSQAGHHVAIVDQERFGAACSHGNCGYVCPSHVLPLSVPGAVGGAMKSLVERNSPFRVKPRMSPSLWKWFWNFSRRCNRRDMLRAGAARHALLQSSMQLYEQFIESRSVDCEWERRGLLMVHDSVEHFEAYASTERLLREEFGVPATPSDSKSLEALEPALKPGLGGAWHYEGDCHLRPDKLMTALRNLLQQQGVEIVEPFQFKKLRGSRTAAAALDPQGREVRGRNFVFAAGALSPLIAREIGCSIPIQPGKGYSITTNRPTTCPALPMIFESHRVAVTPLQTGFRIGSTMEFVGYDTTVDPKRLSLLRNGAESYLQEPYGDTVEEKWYGWRPMTWDGKPLIGPSPRWSNVFIAAGHNMLGLSMAPATGKLIREMIDGETPHIDAEPYSPQRFG